MDSPILLVPFVSPTLEPKAEKDAPVAAFFVELTQWVTKETILGTIFMKKDENQCKFAHTKFADRSRNNE